MLFGLSIIVSLVDHNHLIGRLYLSFDWLVVGLYSETEILLVDLLRLDVKLTMNRGNVLTLTCPFSLSLSLSLTLLFSSLFPHSLLLSLPTTRYLDRERTTAGENYLVKYSWGPRAQVEVDKKQLLTFVAEIYGGDFSQWERQFSDIIHGSEQPGQH